MSGWEIKIPDASPDQPLDGGALVDLPFALDDPEDRAVTRDVLFHARLAGLRNVGEVMLGLEGLSRDERRQVLDASRRRCGLETASDIEWRKASEMRQRALASRPNLSPEGQIQGCAVCGRIAANAVGMPTPTRAKRWHCDEHLDQAEPGDMEPYEPRAIALPGGGFQFEAEQQEEARRAAADDRVREQAEAQRAEQREYEARERAALEEARAARFQAELFGGS